MNQSSIKTKSQLLQIRTIAITLSLSGFAGAARAQSTEVALFYWLFIGGGGILLLSLVGWLAYILFRSRKSDENREFRNANTERGHGGRLGE